MTALLTLPQAAAALQVSPKSLRRLVRIDPADLSAPVGANRSAQNEVSTELNIILQHRR